MSIDQTDHVKTMSSKTQPSNAKIKLIHETDQSNFPFDLNFKASVINTHRGILLERLEAENMPNWVQITEDESTRPPETKVLFFSAQSHVVSDYGRYGLIGDWWRPLTDFDRPPQEKTNV